MLKDEMQTIRYICEIAGISTELISYIDPLSWLSEPRGSVYVSTEALSVWWKGSGSWVSLSVADMKDSYMERRSRSATVYVLEAWEVLRKAVMTKFVKRNSSMPNTLFIFNDSQNAYPRKSRLQILNDHGSVKHISLVRMFKVRRETQQDSTAMFFVSCAMCTSTRTAHRFASYALLASQRQSRGPYRNFISKRQFKVPVDSSQLYAGKLFADRRNTTAVFALSSGTLGAALEASVCGYRAIALSFAFFDRENKPEIVAESCQQSIRVIGWLAKHGKWEASQLYSVNVPVQKGVLQRKVVWTKMLQNQWKRGACFQELPANASVEDPASEEAKLRRQEGVQGGESSVATPDVDPYKHRHFKWQPRYILRSRCFDFGVVELTIRRFTDVYEGVLAAGPGSDGWAVKEGETSVTAIRANFAHIDGYDGELKL
nr:putative tubulin--tyrosine ligase pby1 [Quercus suber]